MTPEDLSPADRELAQSALARIYLARLKRLEWDRQFLRERVTGLVRPRIYTLKKFERLTRDPAREVLTPGS